MTIEPEIMQYAQSEQITADDAIAIAYEERRRPSSVPTL
jgi:hypothetical protein